MFRLSGDVYISFGRIFILTSLENVQTIISDRVSPVGFVPVLVFFVAGKAV
jgi:hypothetical protein